MSRREEESEHDLITAAQGLVEHLKRFEKLGQQLRDEPLTSQRGLEKAAALLNEIASSDEAMGVALKTLVTAINATREHQTAQAQRVSASASAIQERTEIFRTLMLEWARLGERAAELKDVAQHIAQSTPDGLSSLSAERLAEVVNGLQALEAKHLEVSAAAQALAADANHKMFTDVAKQADALRQQLLAAHNKLGLLRKRLSS